MTEVGCACASIFSCGGMTSRTTWTHALSISTLYKAGARARKSRRRFTISADDIASEVTSPRYTERLMRTLAIAFAFAATVTAAAQSLAPASKAPPYVAAKTAWGDPDLQGTYTDKDENGIPMEKPAQFQG